MVCIFFNTYPVNSVIQPSNNWKLKETFDSRLFLSEVSFSQIREWVAKGKAVEQQNFSVVGLHWTVPSQPVVSWRERWNSSETQKELWEGGGERRTTIGQIKWKIVFLKLLFEIKLAIAVFPTLETSDRFPFFLPSHQSLVLAWCRPTILPT